LRLVDVRGLGRRALRVLAPGSGSIIGVATDHDVIALTFDDGPHPDVTPRVLDLLSRHRVRATFFMVGRAAAAHPDLVDAVAQAGHAIGNHSWDHRSLVDDSPPGWWAADRWRRSQILEGERALRGHGTHLFRPPHGHQDWATRVDAMVTRSRLIGWTIGAGDWLDDPAELMALRVLHVAKPGHILLFHDGLADHQRPISFDRTRSLEALELVLDGLHHLRFVTVPELLALGEPKYRYSYPVPLRTDGPVGRSEVGLPLGAQLVDE
jgi:peptidoglycan/xylan/chitin deacetylase (PgdA/CDA1 family)